MQIPARELKGGGGERRGRGLEGSNTRKGIESLTTLAGAMFSIIDKYPQGN